MLLSQGNLRRVWVNIWRTDRYCYGIDCFALSSQWQNAQVIARSSSNHQKLNSNIFSFENVSWLKRYLFLSWFPTARGRTNTSLPYPDSSRQSMNLPRWWAQIWNLVQALPELTRVLSPTNEARELAEILSMCCKCEMSVITQEILIVSSTSHKIPTNVHLIRPKMRKIAS